MGRDALRDWHQGAWAPRHAVQRFLILATTAILADDYPMKKLADIARDALELAPAQRLTLARILLDVSEPGEDTYADAEGAWEEEIIRRMDAVKDGTAQAKDFDAVFAELDRKFPSGS